MDAQGLGVAALGIVCAVLVIALAIGISYALTLQTALSRV